MDLFSFRNRLTDFGNRAEAFASARSSIKRPVVVIERIVQKEVPKKRGRFEREAMPEKQTASDKPKPQNERKKNKSVKSTDETARVTQKND